MDGIPVLIDIASFVFLLVVEVPLIFYIIKNNPGFDWKNGFHEWWYQFKLLLILPLLRRPSCIEKIFMTIFQFLRATALSNFFSGCFAKNKDVKDTSIEAYVFGFFLLLYTFLRFSTFFLNYSLTRWIILYWLITMLSYQFSIIFVDRYSGVHIRSLNRSLLLLVVNYFGVIVAFAIFYLATDSIVWVSCGNPITSWTSALYFSAVTITTLGCQDIKPLAGLGRTLAPLEVIIGLSLLILAFEIFMTLYSETEDDGRAYYDKALVYVFKGDKDNALENLTKAIGLDAEFKDMAKNNEVFENLWDDEDFKRIVD